MASATEIEIARALRQSQERYTYYLLTAVAAGIALAVNQTHSATLRWPLALLAIAVICWGLSFFFGCRRVAYANSILFANANLLKAQSGRHPDVGDHPEAIAIATETIREAWERNDGQADLSQRLQFGLLLTGAVLYVAWHVLEIALRTI